MSREERSTENRLFVLWKEISLKLIRGDGRGFRTVFRVRGSTFIERTKDGNGVYEKGYCTKLHIERKWVGMTERKGQGNHVFAGGKGELTGEVTVDGG